MQAFWIPPALGGGGQWVSYCRVVPAASEVQVAQFGVPLGVGHWYSQLA